MTRLAKQYEYEWQMTHPLVEQSITNVSKPIRKRKGITLTLKEENEELRVVASRERRCDVVCRLAMELEYDSDDDE